MKRLPLGIPGQSWVGIVMFFLASLFFYFFVEAHWIGWLFVGGTVLVFGEALYSARCQNNHRR